MKTNEVANHITAWLNDYCNQAGLSGFIVGISGGVDSALTSTLCAMTGKKTILLSMPIRQKKTEHSRAMNHIAFLRTRFPNVESFDIDLTSTFTDFELKMPFNVKDQHLAMANSRARIRMTCLYAIGQAHGCLVAGTGNKIEDFGIGFFTKYGDGGVDLNPIGDLTKSEVWEVAKEIGVLDEITSAKPTDGLWEDDRSDEDQIGASYPELEWAMSFEGDMVTLTPRQKEVLSIYKNLHGINAHKISPIPVCLIPIDLK